MASNFVNDCVRAMNVYRSFHQVSALTHNPQITSIAQAWADRLAASGSLSHNTNASYRGENLGENCAMRWTSDRQEVTGIYILFIYYKCRTRSKFTQNMQIAYSYVVSVHPISVALKTVLGLFTIAINNTICGFP